MTELAEQMQRQALAAQKFTRKYFVVELDFSSASIDELEGQFKTASYALRGGLSAENVTQLTELWGAYLGEMIRRATQAEWLDAHEADARCWCLRHGPASVYPHQAIADRLADGREPNLRAFFDAALASLRGPLTE